MDMIKPRTLSGFMELLPDKQIKLEKMMEILRKTYASYGFAPLDTPAIEDAQILLAKGGGETEKQIYRFTKGDSDLALWPNTLPCTTMSWPFPSAASRSARSTGVSEPREAASGNSTRRISTSSATESWIFSMRRKSPPLSIRSSGASA